MKFSVLICTYNRHEMLRRCLLALIEDSEEKADEIIVVNGGDGRADEVVRSFMDETGCHVVTDMKLVNTQNKNLATSRNIGLGHCTGDIVAMTDDDAEVFPNWVSSMKRAHTAQPEAGAVGGPVYGSNVESLVGKVADAITFPTWDGPREVRTLPGVNIAFKRSALEAIGFQDEALFRGEDVDFNWRLIKAGYKIYFDPSIQVHHHHRPTVKGFLNQHYMYGRAYYLVRRKWPDMYCIYPHRLHRFKDYLKAGNFAVGLIYQPFLSATRLSTWRDRVAALPLLLLAGATWRSGMIVQALRELFAPTPVAQVPQAESIGVAH